METTALDQKDFPLPEIREVTLADLARTCRLSVATVSSALNGSSRVAAVTQKRVQATAQRLGYAPNPAARRLALGRSRKEGGRAASEQVGFVVISGSDRCLDQPYLRMLNGADREIARHGGNLVFFHCEGAEGMERLMRVVRHGSIDGWLVMGFVDETVRNFFAGLGRPFVILGDHRIQGSVRSVNVNYRAAGEMAARELAAQGHRRIGYLGATMRFAYQRELRDGFRAAVLKLGLDPDPDLIQTGERPGRTERGWDVTPELNALLTLSHRPTAFVASEPATGMTIFSLLRQNELNLPKDASLLVCDWNSSPEAAAGLAMVELPLEELGVTGIALLQEQARDGGDVPGQFRLDPQWKRGWTCAAPVPEFRDTGYGQDVSGVVNT